MSPEPGFGPGVEDADNIDYWSSDEQFTCAHGGTAHETNVCNGRDDCGDGSDETNCASCKGSAFKCEGNNECVTDHQLCDLYDDCEDGNDENNCTSHVCNEIIEFRCKSGQCIYKNARCDGLDHCADKSDEENCLQCFESEWGFSPFKCVANSMCIGREKLCNAIKDCPDGSDEDGTTCQNLQCTDHEFQCSTGHCVTKHSRCHGGDYCGDNSGETNCTECDPHMFKCEKENKCILREQLCDTEPHCEDGSDESKSTCQNFTCSDSSALQCQIGQCVTPYYDAGPLLCNGVPDCNDESDEANCTTCSDLAFKCGSGECVYRYKLCNSKRDCSDGTDENEANCPHGSTPPVWSTNTFWSVSPNRNLTLQYLTQDVAIYFDSSVSLSVTWPFLPLSKAWKYAKETYESAGTFSQPGNQLLFIVVGKINTNHNYPFTKSFRDWRSGHRNVIDAGLRQRNGWDTENAENWGKLIFGLGTIVKDAEEGSVNIAHHKICDLDLAVDDIVFYDIYIHMKGQGSADAMRWRASQFNRTIKVGSINCFRDWMLPIYESYGGVAVLKRFFKIFKVNWPHKEGVYTGIYDGRKQLNVGEFVHFWSGAANVDLSFLAKSAFAKRNDAFVKQFAKAQIDFPNIKYAVQEMPSPEGFFAGTLHRILIVLFMGAGLKLSWDFYH